MNDRTVSIASRFQNLRSQKTENGRFTVLSIEGLPHKLGATREGYPVFFVLMEAQGSAVQGIIREILSVEYNVSCSLVDDGKDEQEGVFAIITLRSTDLSLQADFIEIMLLMLRKISPTPSNRELSGEVENLIAIFDSLSAPPRKKIQGLWAELLVIEQSLEPELLVKAWHSLPSAKYDFTLGEEKIEVKSTASEERIHRFALDQLNPSPNSKLLIASVFVRESGRATSGLSVKDLYFRIRNKVSADSQLHLYTVIAETIGNDVAKLETICFDYTTAVDFLEFYDYRDIPRIAKSDIPDQVTEVRFASNLNGLDDVRKKASTDWSNCPLFRSLGQKTWRER